MNAVKHFGMLKTFYQIRQKKQGKITLVEKGEKVSNDKKLIEIFNEFFENTVSNLNIPEFTGNFDQSVTIVSIFPIINAIAKYENYPSVTKIRNKQVSSENILWNLSEKKACQKFYIPLTLICVGFLGVRFEVEGGKGGKIPPPV